MRASEFTKQELDEKVNPRVVEPGFTAEKRLGNRYVMKAEARYTGEPGDDLRGLIIKVYDTKAKPTMLNWGIGMTRFVARQDPTTQDWYLVSSTTHVDDRYQRQGLASAMYNWARELGNDIEPSSNRTKMGKHFWEKGAGAGREFVDQPPETAASPAIPTSTAAGPAKAQSLRDRLVKMFTEEPGLAERKQSPLEDFEGLQFRMVNDNGQLFVNAFDSSGVNELGHVTFDIGDGKELDPQNLYVKHKFRSQGIAQIMYDFVKSKGYKIQRSWDQTDAGAGFWDKHRGEERVWEQDDSEARSHDFMAGHCHVMAIALKQLHPDWQIRAHVGYDDDEADDTEYRVDHVYTVAPDGTAYDCRGRFDNEQQLVGPDTTGGVDTQYVNFGPEEIKQAMLRGELKRFTKQDLANAMQTATQAGKQDVAEGATVTRIDSKPITDFGPSLKAYKHTDDWSQSGVDTGDDSYWKNKNLKTNTTKGLFAGDPKRTALYATGNAHETRYVEFTQDGQPIVYFDRKDLPAMRSRKTYLTVFDASDFRQLPTGEWFSENPSKPIKQIPISDPFKYIASQGWIVRVTDDLDKVFKQVKNMHKAGKIAQYGAEGMNESKQGVAENFADGRNPQDKGDSKRHGINTKASVSSLRKTAKQGGRKGQLAHWLANMKSGRAKKK